MGVAPHLRRSIEGRGKGCRRNGIKFFQRGQVSPREVEIVTFAVGALSDDACRKNRERRTCMLQYPEDKLLVHLPQ